MFHRSTILVLALALTMGVGSTAFANPMEPKAKGFVEAQHTIIGSWVGMDSSATADQAPSGLKITHHFTSPLKDASNGHHYGAYRFVEEISDLPRRGCKRTTDRSGTFDYDGNKLLVVSVKEGKSTTRCPNANPVDRVLEGESRQSYQAEVSGDLLALRSITNGSSGGATVSPVLFKREER